MENSKSYSAKDIENLKQKISAYRDTLITLKVDNSAEDTIFLLREINKLKVQVLFLKGELNRMNDNQIKNNDDVEQQNNNFPAKIEEINKDFSNTVNTFVKRTTNDTIDKTTTSNKQQGISLLQQIDSTPYFKQLTGTVLNTNATDDNLMEGIHVKHTENLTLNSEKKQLNRLNFPSTGNLPSQLSNGRYGNVPLKTNIYFKELVTNERIPVGDDEIPSTSFINEPEEIETKLEDANEVETTPKDSNKVDTSLKDYNEVHPISLIAETLETNISLTETIQVEEKKEGFSLSNIFRKRR